MESASQSRPVMHSGGQSSNVGMLPPSDSEEEEEEGAAKPAPKAPAPKGQPATAGLMPPSDSEDSEDSESSDDEPAYLKAAPRKK